MLPYFWDSSLCESILNVLLFRLNRTVLRRKGGRRKTGDSFKFLPNSGNEPATSVLFVNRYFPSPAVARFFTALPPEHHVVKPLGLKRAICEALWPQWGSFWNDSNAWQGLCQHRCAVVIFILVSNGKAVLDCLPSNLVDKFPEVINPLFTKQVIFPPKCLPN